MSKRMSIGEFQNAVATKDVAYQEAIDTLTYLDKRVTEQKFYEISVADFIPVEVGTGAFSQSIQIFLSQYISDNFETGNINTGENSRLSEADATVDQQNVKIQNWAKYVKYTIFDVFQAQTLGNWDVIEAKLKARKKNWDLGVQKTAFLGSTSNSNVEGLLTGSSVTSNLTTITEPIKDMTDSEFQTFVGKLFADYFSNSNDTAIPNRFLIPSSDYLGLGAAASSTFPNITRLQYLTNVFKEIAAGFGVNDFQIAPLSYCDATRNSDVLGSGSGLQRYVLYRTDADAGNMYLPVDYTETTFDTNNNFTFQNVGYGQYTGFVFRRPKEFLYFDYTPYGA